MKKAADSALRYLKQRYSHLKQEKRLCPEWKDGGPDSFIQWAWGEGFEIGMSVRCEKAPKDCGPKTCKLVPARSKASAVPAGGVPARAELLKVEMDGEYYTFRQLGELHYQQHYESEQKERGAQLSNDAAVRAEIRLRAQCVQRVYQRIHFGRWSAREAVDTIKETGYTKYPGKLNWLERTPAKIVKSERPKIEK